MVTSISDLIVIATLVFAVLSAVIVGWFLVERPAVTASVKIVLLVGIFVLPVMSATSGNIAGYEATKSREFCSGCHVMLPYTDDAATKTSTTLAALHARNESFGDENCYGCHADYAMFGAVTTKLVGLKHAYYYGTRYLGVPVEEALGTFHLYAPFPNKNCMHCHSTELPGFVELPDHRGALEEIRSGDHSCVGSGCHGPVHPFSKELNR